MADFNNRHGLRVVQEGDAALDQIELLVARAGGPRVCIVEGDVVRTQINLTLAEFAAMSLDTRASCGICLLLPVRWKGAEKGISGDLSPCCTSPGVVVPRGTIAQWMAEAA
jgi:hypothetical protein